MANEYIDAILRKKKREPENPYLPADGTLAQMRANSMSGYVPNEFAMPNMNPMLGYKSRYGEQSGGRPNSLDSNVPKGQQPAKDYTGYGMPEADDGDKLEKYIFNGYPSPVNEKRIAEIDKRIAEIEAQLKGYDEEEEMGKYKFLYEGDPSTYTSVKQNKRNAVQTEKIRKATEDATKASNLQTAWKDNVLQLETNNIDLANAKANYEAAKKSGDTKNLPSLNLAYKQALAKRKRLLSDNEMLRQKLAQSSGLEMSSSGQFDPEKETGFDTEKDIASIELLDKLKGNADRLSKDYDKPNYSVSKNELKAKYDAGKAEIEKYEEALKDAEGKLDERERQSLLTGLDELKRKVELWRPGTKDKNRPNVTKTKEDYEKMLSGLNDEQIVNKGAAVLSAAKKLGVQGLDAFIKEAIARGIN